MERERERFAAEHPGSRALHERGKKSLLSGVPMNWMTRWPGDFPVFMESAEGATLRDVDGNVYADLCLGDTGAMTGHAPAATIAAVKERLDRGITAMLPTEDALAVGEEMQRRFGLRDWQFTLSATDANRFVIRICRQITGRSKIIVHNHCYHGSVDETVATLVDGEVTPRETAASARRSPVAETTRVVEINDLEGLERELADGDVACVMIEPALTNIGIVLADDGYHEAGPRADPRSTGRCWSSTRRTRSAAAPVATRAPTGSSPTSSRSASRSAAASRPAPTASAPRSPSGSSNHTFWPEADVGGVGGTLAGNALSLAAVRATLAEVLTDEAFERMIALGRAVRGRASSTTIAARGLPWSITRLGCRAEYMFSPTPAPRPAPRPPRRSTGARRPAAPLHAQPRRPADAVPHDGADVAGDDRRAGRPAPGRLREAAAELTGG